VLTNDLVLIQDYDSSWPDVFSRLASRVKAALGDLVLTVEHVGSTAVPGLAAKPIIDLDVVVPSPTDLPEAVCGRRGTLIWRPGNGRVRLADAY
jgi:GrpB-like predicted nucleotidyltransferase (UPF0157 family)